MKRIDWSGLKRTAADLGYALLQAFQSGVPMRATYTVPWFILLTVSAVNYDGVRHFLLTIPAAEMQRMVAWLMVASFFLGMSVYALAQVISLRTALRGDARLIDESGDFAQDLCNQELIQSDRAPSIAVHHELRSLQASLGRSSVQGSDLLDQRILKALGLSVRLKPTQSEADAQALLGWRYSGLKSGLTWKTSLLTGKPIVARIWISNPESPDTWLYCTQARGQTPALAITRAALSRELWVRSRAW